MTAADHRLAALLAALAAPDADALARYVEQPHGQHLGATLAARAGAGRAARLAALAELVAAESFRPEAPSAGLRRLLAEERDRARRDRDDRPPP